LTIECVLVAARAASEKTLEDTVVLDLCDHGTITDYFVITSGRNDRQVRAIVDEIILKVRSVGGGPPRSTEGTKEARWVLLDYGDFVVHIFDTATREFYGLERLWSDTTRVDWDETRKVDPVPS
jgi:ribosome-associated protein